MPLRLGPWELGLVLLIVIIVFGAGKLPQAGGALVKSIRAIRQASSNEQKVIRGNKPSQAA